MIRIIVAVATVLGFQFANADEFHPLHIDLGATGRTYREALKAEMARHPRLFVEMNDVDIENAISMGEILWKWIDTINGARPEAQKIRLYSVDNMTAIPIDNAKKYSPSIVKKDTDDLFSKLPVAMANIVKGVAPYNSTTAGLSDVDFADWARKVDRLYQTSVRWKLVSPNIFYYRLRKTEDVRGYYFLTRTADIENKLTNWNSLSAAEKTQFRPWLENLCENGGGTNCSGRVGSAIGSNQVNQFYKSALPAAKAKWDHFFKLGGVRRDISWAGPNVNTMTVPFRIANATEDAWMRFNIEDEWRFGSWQLKLNFTPSAAIHVVWEPNVVPHVNGLGGNQITMDSTSSMDEWDVQWTIRHEFGHSLGLPDCYVEFYDDNEQAMVNYQLDITNLMCSRRGELQQIHVDELKKAYYKPLSWDLKKLKPLLRR